MSPAAAVAAVALSLHALSVALAWRRCAGRAAPPAFEGRLPSVTIVQPQRGLEPFSDATLASVFALDYPDYEIVFCVVSESDPIVPLIRRHIAANPHRPARILFGDNPISGNPKLNNIVKGWRAARRDWIALADSNVLMPRDYLTRLMARWRADTGIVASPPIGAAPQGFAAYLECAFLNAYQARWQYAAEAVGFGFAQGKTMLWRKRFLDEAGGVEALAAEIAEDAAATKIVRRAGLSAHLVDRPFPQPLGRRKLADVWKRQVRWARLRRATFAPYFLPEALTTGLLPILAAAFVSPVLGLGAALVWYGAELALTAASGWPVGPWTLPAAMARDALLPWLWVQGLASDRFEWRGAALSVDGFASPDPTPTT